MISNNKLIDFYNRASEEYQHPDAGKAIFGRAEQQGRKSDTDKLGRVGLFGVSKKKANKLGWTDLENPEQNFRAAMELDLEGYDTGDLAEMYLKTAGVTGGDREKDKYIISLDEAFDTISQEIVWDDGQPVDIKTESPTENESQEEHITPEASKETQVEDTKRASAHMQQSAARNFIEGEDLRSELDEALGLLKEYISKSVK